MFLNRLMDRAANAPEVLRPAPKLAAELNDPSWGDPAPLEDWPDDHSTVIAETDALRDMTPHRNEGDAKTTLRQASASDIVSDSHPQTDTHVAAPKRLSASETDIPPGTPAVSYDGATEPAYLHGIDHSTPDPMSIPSALHPDQAVATSNQPQAAPTPIEPTEPWDSLARNDRSDSELATEQQIEQLLDIHAEKSETQASEQTIEIVVEIGKIDLVTPPPAETAAPAMPLARPRPGPRTTLSDYLAHRSGGRS